MFNNFSINDSQVKNILDEFSNLKYLEESKANLYLGSRHASIGKENSTKQRIINYLSTWAGWSTNLSQLPVLTKKIVIFTKDLVASQKKSPIDPEEVLSAIQGLGVLLHCQGKNEDQAAFIETAIEDLKEVLNLLSERKEVDLQENPLELPASQDNENQVPPSKRRRAWNAMKNLWPTKMPNVSTLKAYIYKTPSANVATNNEPTTLDVIQNYIDKIISNAMPKNSLQLPLTIKSLLNDRTLANVQDYPYKKEVSAEEKNTLTIPTQFYNDCKRFDSLTLNGQTFFQSNTKNQITEEEIADSFIKQLGQKDFNYICKLVQQSLIADWVKDVQFPIVDDASYPLLIKQQTGFDFNINFDESTIKINAKIILVFINFVEYEEIKEKTEIKYTLLERQIEFPRKEMEEFDKIELSTQDSDKLEALMPNLKVSQSISNFSSIDDATLAMKK